MKKIVAATAILASLALGARAQCDKKISWNSSKAIFLGADGKEERVEENKIKIETSKSTVIIHPGENENEILSGDVKDFNCDWKEAFKNGKTIIKVPLADQRGDIKNATLTIEGKEGKITIYLEIEEMPGKKIQVPVDSHDEA
jgi:hypothetical protein